MSRKGDCWDHAVSENFFPTLKVELVDGKVYATREADQLAIFESIEVFYNRPRKHSTLGYLTPWQKDPLARNVA